MQSWAYSIIRYSDGISVVFLCRYSDELIRFCMMAYHFATGKWVRPITPEGKAALPTFMATRKVKGFSFGLADREG